MSNISSKINLAALKHSVRKMKGQTGEVECLIIPIEANNLFKGEKGVYLDTTGFEIKNKTGTSKDTHLVKQSLPKEVYEKMTDEQKKEQPIIGSMIVWAGGGSLGDAAIIEQDESDDLPF
jgi:hypothetical protein